MTKKIVVKMLTGVTASILSVTGSAAPTAIQYAQNTAAVSAISGEDTLAAGEIADAKITGAVSEYTAQVIATPQQNVSAATAQDSGSAMVRVCQCQEHFVMEGDWKTEWRKHVIEVHHGCCHWGDNEFTEAEMRELWPEDFEDKTVEDTSETVQAAAANTKTSDLIAYYNCSCGFYTTDKRELMRHTVAGNKTGDMIHSYNTTYKTPEEAEAYEAKMQAAKDAAAEKAAEEAAAEQAAKEAAEKAAKEQAEREAAEKAAKEQAEREAAEKAAKEQAEREAAEKAAKEQAEREAAEKAAKEQAEREAAEKAAREQAEREAAEKAARKAELEAAEKAWWESIEKKRCPKCGTEYPADAEHGCGVVYHEYKVE